MNELPIGWERVLLGEITTEPSQKIPAESNEFTYIDIASIDRATKKIIAPQRLLGKDAPSRARKLVQTGDTLVSMTRPNLNAVALVPECFSGEIASTGFDVLRPVGIDPRWVAYLVRTNNFITEMTSLTQGALYPAVRSKDIRTYLTPLAPFSEQKRIADKIDALLMQVDACRNRLDKIPGIINRFRQAVLTAGLNGKLSCHNDKFIKNWPKVKLETLAFSFSYGTSAKSAKNGTTPVLRMGNIQNGALDWSDLVFTSDQAEIEKYRLQAGDVLFNRTNSPELVGKTAVYQGEFPAVYAGYLIRVRCKPTLNPIFLNYWLNSPYGRDYCWQVKTDGVSQSNINAKKLAAFEFHLPPIAEQEEIVRRVETLFAFADRLEARYTTARAQVENLTPALLAKAFRGELVPQDPSDEPADELLKRIRAASQIPKIKVRK